MNYENGEWIMYGADKEDTDCIQSVEELIEYVDKIGFLPLFKNEIPGFSVEERTAASDWWTGDVKKDPWEWREVIAASGKLVYGKFFHKKAGFISKEWFPYFVNYRRDGYDFDARYEDGLAEHRSKKIMDLFEDKDELYSFEMKKGAGFGKNGEKNFEGVISGLQMQTYLVAKDFRKKKNKAGEPYGWNVAVYAVPEKIWGYDYVTKAYKEEPNVSKERIIYHMKELYPDVTEKDIKKAVL